MDHLLGQWRFSEMVSPPDIAKTVKGHGKKTYKYELPTGLVCLREASTAHCGILVKPLGRYASKELIIIKKAPFCKDAKLMVGLNQATYYCYPFPTVSQLKEVLDIIRSDSAVREVLEAQQMHISPTATYWVSDTHRRLLFSRQVQYYDPQTDSLHTAKDGDETHHRLTIAFFLKE